MVFSEGEVDKGCDGKSIGYCKSEKSFFISLGFREGILEEVVFELRFKGCIGVS